MMHTRSVEKTSAYASSVVLVGPSLYNTGNLFPKLAVASRRGDYKVPPRDTFKFSLVLSPFNSLQYTQYNTTTVQLHTLLLFRKVFAPLIARVSFQSNAGIDRPLNPYIERKQYK